MICLNSAGNLVRSEVGKKEERYHRGSFSCFVQLRLLFRASRAQDRDSCTEPCPSARIEDSLKKQSRAAANEHHIKPATPPPPKQRPFSIEKGYLLVSSSSTTTASQWLQPLLHAIMGSRPPGGTEKEPTPPGAGSAFGATELGGRGASSPTSHPNPNKLRQAQGARASLRRWAELRRPSDGRGQRTDPWPQYAFKMSMFNVSCNSH